VGGTKPVKVDIRIIATSNRDLADAVKHGTFREDLLYRLNVVNLRLPALRERPKDIRALSQHFARKYAEANGVPFRLSREAMAWLKQLQLPGNIRQLKNLVERTVLISPRDELQLIDFQMQYQPGAKKDGGLPEVGAMTLEEMEVQMIRRAMDFHKGKIARVAKSLGLTRSALYRRL